jgi:hypothetical protein
MTRIAQLKLTSPAGYGAVVPLDKQKHAGLGLKANTDHLWCANLNAVFINAAEFVKAALDYPIAFARDPGSGEFMPVAVLGLRAKQNLFVDAQGQWRPLTYIPAYFRRFPFCIAEIPGKNGAAASRMICVQEDRLVKDGTALFGAGGEPTATWEPVLKLLEAIEGSRQQTRVFTRRLEALNLLVPFDAVALPRSGQQMRLQGMFRVDEQKLQEIPGKDLRTLMKKGELRAVYAHLVSLENFGRLLDLTASRSAH